MKHPLSFLVFLLCAATQISAPGIANDMPGAPGGFTPRGPGGPGPGWFGAPRFGPGFGGPNYGPPPSYGSPPPGDYGNAPGYVGPAPSPPPPPAPTDAPVPNPSPSPAAAAPDWTQVETSISAASKQLGFSTTWVARGVVGLWPWASAYWSCAGASADRANAVADKLQGLADSGALGNYTVSVGSRNGYQINGASFHTYTVVQFKDPKGRVVKTYDVDNYVLPTSVQASDPGAIPNFDPISGDSTVIRTVTPPATPPAGPTQ